MTTTQRPCNHCGATMSCTTSRRQFCNELCRANYNKRLALLQAVERVINKETRYGYCQHHNTDIV